MATTNILPISNIINVSITTVPVGLQTPNVNSLALFTTETPSNIDTYRTYQNATQVATDYGTNTVTAAMASAVFGQMPNILTGNGQLVVIPLLSSVSATAGNFVTADISANLAGLIAVTNGNIRITVNGTAYNLTLNFTGCVTLADIAIKIAAALPSSLTVTASSTTITITSDKVGSSSTVAMAAYSGGGTDLNGASYLKGASGTATAGANASGETILSAITRTSGIVFYAGVMTNLNMEDAVIATTATGIQALDNIFIHHCSSAADIAGIATTVKAASNTKTRLVLYATGGQSSANLTKAAYAGRLFSTNWTGSNTATTMNIKSLAGITPDTGINQTYYDAAKVAGIDLYVSYSGVPAVLSTGGNDYADNIYANLAMKLDFQTAGFNYLAQTNTKVPQTEQGMNGLKDAYAQVARQYVNNGAIAAGHWNSSQTFGDPQTFADNITLNGYYIYSQPIAQQSQANRNNRIAPLVQIALKRSGAIHTGSVIVLIEN
jgi:Protein of unknown function (DUF3383)